MLGFTITLVTLSAFTVLTSILLIIGLQGVSFTFPSSFTVQYINVGRVQTTFTEKEQESASSLLRQIKITMFFRRKFDECHPHKSKERNLPFCCCWWWGCERTSQVSKILKSRKHGSIDDFSFLVEHSLWLSIQSGLRTLTPSVKSYHPLLFYPFFSTCWAAFCFLMDFLTLRTSTCFQD